MHPGQWRLSAGPRGPPKASPFSGEPAARLPPRRKAPPANARLPRGWTSHPLPCAPRTLIGKGHFLLYPITQPLGFPVPQAALSGRRGPEPAPKDAPPAPAVPPAPPAQASFGPSRPGGAPDSAFARRTPTLSPPGGPDPGAFFGMPRLGRGRRWGLRGCGHRPPSGPRRRRSPPSPGPGLPAPCSLAAAGPAVGGPRARRLDGTQRAGWREEPAMD